MGWVQHTRGVLGNALLKLGAVRHGQRRGSNGNRIHALVCLCKLDGDCPRNGDASLLSWGPPTACPLRSGIHARHAVRFTSSRGLRRTAFCKNSPFSTSGLCRLICARKVENLPILCIWHIGSRVQNRASFQAGAVEFGWPGCFQGFAATLLGVGEWAFGRKTGHSLQAMVECGCPVLAWGGTQPGATHWDTRASFPPPGGNRNSPRGLPVGDQVPSVASKVSSRSGPTSVTTASAL